jgi:hypothetical protein
MAKPRAQKLKVFRTPIGFHDAYVAAPSQKAALEAWGADSNLFAQGIAEVVTDPALMEEALAQPGEVVRKLRGSAEDHVRALGDPPKPPARRVPANDQLDDEETRPAPRSRARNARAAPPRKAKPPRPSRAPVEKAEAALARAEDAHPHEIDAIRAEQEALEARRREVEQSYREQWDALSAELEQARKDYRRAMAEWAD